MSIVQPYFYFQLDFNSPVEYLTSMECKHDMK